MGGAVSFIKHSTAKIYSFSSARQDITLQFSLQRISIKLLALAVLKMAWYWKARCPVGDHSGKQLVHLFIFIN